MHHSVLVNSQESDTGKSGDGVDPRGEVFQEGMDSLSVASLPGEGDSILLGYLDPVRQSFNKLVGELVSPKHLSHQPRRLQGVRANHGIWAVVVCITWSHKACSHVRVNFVS